MSGRWWLVRYDTCVYLVQVKPDRYDTCVYLVQVKPDTIIQVWSGDSYNIDHVTRNGFRALFSTCWYLDYISYGQDWDKYYNCEQISTLPAPYVHSVNPAVLNKPLLLYSIMPSPLKGCRGNCRPGGK